MSGGVFERFRATLRESPPEGDLPVRVEGHVPLDLRGDWLSNGPVVFGAGDVRYRHWLDGDGWVLRIRLSEVASATARLVATVKREIEAVEGRAVFRTFGTAFPGDRLVLGQGLESPANISVESWAGRLLAFGEQGLPYELDPETLETRGPFTFDRRLNAASPLAAHPKIDPRTGEHVAFGVSFSPQRPTLTLYQATPDLETRRLRVPLPFAATLHDFAITGRHAVFYVAPYVLDLRALREEERSVLGSLSWKPELGSRLLVVERESGDVVFHGPVDGAYCLHLANAFDGEGGVVVDLLELDRPVYPHYFLDSLYDGAPLGRPVRWVVDLESGQASRQAHDDLESSLDFPVVPADAVGLPTDVVWYLSMSRSRDPGPKLFDRLVRLDWSTTEARTFAAPEGAYFSGEPALTEGARHLLVPVTTPERSELWIVDPGLREQEPRARVVGDGFWPHRFHGAWVRS
jgi:carotenoid cleavage dioxygenase-like enzyme